MPSAARDGPIERRDILGGVLHDPIGKLPTLWEAVDFAGTGEGSWEDKMAYIWMLRQHLAATYPGQIFTGRIKGERPMLRAEDEWVSSRCRGYFLYPLSN